MVKKIVAGFCLLASLLAFCFWYLCIKEKLVTENGVLMYCRSNNQLHIELMEDVHLITGITAVNENDTLKVEVRITTIANPFAINRSYDKTIAIKPGVKYIKVANITLPLVALKSCQF